MTFDFFDNLEFKVRNIFQEYKTTIIEFILTLDDMILSGLDIIEWKDNKIKKLRACLDIPVSNIL